MHENQHEVITWRHVSTNKKFEVGKVKESLAGKDW
jgi:hypothetical protein